QKSLGKDKGETMSGSQVSRRAVLAGMAAAPFVHAASAETNWPNPPVQVMVPYPPAGGADTTARILYAKLGTMLAQQFVIENRGGGGGPSPAPPRAQGA